ncbi:hypothetical protein [Nonomuraea sp. NPDC049646]|uniref:hypothetical protein n=1 Tax=unclassified Nonomuraea TaxID=2593643 RepID=UPI00378B61BF
MTATLADLTPLLIAAAACLVAAVVRLCERRRRTRASEHAIAAACEHLRSQLADDACPTMPLQIVAPASARQPPRRTTAASHAPARPVSRRRPAVPAGRNADAFLVSLQTGHHWQAPPPAAADMIAMTPRGSAAGRKASTVGGLQTA